ncbi:MAG: HAMP domain-containing histidine kinase [Actinomycetota bacterium]|nr:MAG: HAMP domain-containing histidine kinase [Actinomycetota bacterium]
MRRLGLRARLTLLYGALFLVAGAAILAVLYVVVQDRLEREIGVEAADERLLTLRQQAAASGHNTVTLPDGTTIDVNDLVAQVRKDREDIKDAALQSLLWQGSVVVLVIGVVAGATGWLVAGRGLLPLHRVTVVAEHIAAASGPERDLAQRIGTTGRRDDLDRLTTAFDAMLAALQQAFDSQRLFVANASHELRTPIAVERALIELELTRPEAPTETVAFAQLLLDLNRANSELIERLLLLADSTNAVEHAEPVDLATVAGEALVTVAATRDTSVTVTTELSPAVTSGDPVLIGQLVRNLVDNAIVHNTDDGWVSVATVTRDTTAVIRVSNSGPRLAPEDVSGLFEPFRRNRADRTHDTRDGFGLGLAIVAAVAAAHRGTITANPRSEGGLDITVEFATTGNH